MINESTGKTINDSKYSDAVILMIQKGMSDRAIASELKEKYKFKADGRTVKAFRDNFVLSNKETQKKIAELKKQREEKIKKIQEELPTRIFESIESRNNHIKTLQEQIKVTSKIQGEIHEFRNQKLSDIKSIYEKLVAELLAWKPVIDKEKVEDKKSKQLTQLKDLEIKLEELKKLPVERALTLYRANNDAQIMKCIDEIRVLQGEIEQYTQLYDLQGLIDFVAKKVIDIVGMLIIPEIDKNKVSIVVPRFKAEVSKAIDEIKEKTMLEAK